MSQEKSPFNASVFGIGTFLLINTAHLKFFFAGTEPDCVEKDYKVEVSITEGGLVASIKVTPIAEELSAIGVLDLEEALKDAGVNYGVWNDALHRVSDELILNKWVTVAKGEKSGDGKDGCVKYHFSKEGKRVKLHEDSSGRVNFKDMDLIQNVKKGDILCELIPPEEGKMGRTVKGEEVHGKLGAAAKLPPGKGTEVIDNGTKLVAAIDGMVVWMDPEIIVEPVYVVDMVDSSTGNIRFNGSVVVNGEVGDGYEIHAAEDVTIAMSVGRVLIEAGGDIKIAGGILGQEKAHISAQGSIHAKFIQDAVLSAKKEIIVDDYIRSSEVTAAGPVIVRSPNGWISGGMVSSEAWIYCHTLGTASNPIDTDLTIGHNPLLNSEREQYKDEIIEKIGDFLKFQASIAKLRAIKGQSQLSPPQQHLYEKILSAVDTIRHTLIQKDTRFRELTDRINTIFAGNIYIEGAANEGTKIMIGKAKLEIQQMKRQVQFSLKEGSIAESEFVMLPEIKGYLESE